MDDRNKTIGMIVLCCLLFLFAGVRFWSMAADSRQQAELNSRNSPIQQRIVSRYGPPMMAKKDPFGELGLTAEQRRKIDDIMNSSMPKLPPPGAGGGARRNVLITMGAGPVPPRPGEALAAAPGPNGQHVVRINIPMDKIRAILTPEQQRKFDQMHKQPTMPGKMLPPGAPPGPGPSASHPAGGPGNVVFLGRPADGGAP